MGRALIGLGVLAALLTAVILSQPSEVHSLATFVVNDAGDLGDNDTGDGVCNTGFSTCTLRAAIDQANAILGLDTIEISIGSGAQTIAPDSALPTISDPVIIDGTTQPSFTGTPSSNSTGRAQPLTTNDYDAGGGRPL